MTDRPWLRGSSRPLSTGYDVALLDLDGVVYVGPDAVPGAVEGIAAARADGMRMGFVTNNASRTPETVARHLTELGVDAQAEEVITSSMAAMGLLAELVPAASTVLVVGDEGLRAAVTEAGYGLGTSADAVDAVVQGYAALTTWADLAEASLAVARGIPWIATNLDTTLPTPRGLVPGNGALVGVVATTTGRRPVAAGKPERPLHDEAVRRSKARCPLVVGDRLDTDIEGAVRANADSLLVLTGVTDKDSLLLATPQQRPTYISADLSGLRASHPDVAIETSGTAVCRGWRAELQPSGVHLTRIEDARLHDQDDGLDALRATAAATWSADDGS